MNNFSHHNRRSMLRDWLTVMLLVVLQISLQSALPNDASRILDVNRITPRNDIQAEYGKLPLAFEMNQGQAASTTSYLVHHGRATTYFDGISATTTIGADHVTMSLDNAARTDFKSLDSLDGTVSYFIGADRSTWKANIPTYKELLAENIYPGIDLKYYGTNSQLEHDFIVKPGADYSQISFHFDGQNNQELNDRGDLELSMSSGLAILRAPITYQQSNGSRRMIPSHFVSQDKHITIALDTNYDQSQALIIDPTLLYSTYLGGSATDAGYSVAVGSDGSAYLVGTTQSSNFPTSSPYDGSLGGASDIFVAKFNAAGTALTYSTYIGGSGNEESRDIAVDSSGNVYITGDEDSTDFPTASPMQSTNGGGIDGFITKLNASGSALTYSTYLGGSGTDVGDDIAIDSSGNAYIAGQTRSTNFPTTSPMQAAHGGGVDDAFVTKLNAAGSARTYSTYLGGSGADLAMGIAVDSSGNAYIAGSTASTNFPTTSPMQASSGGGGDAYITKLNAAGSARTYSTYLGGSGADEARAIAIDSSGNAYVSGDTSSTNFPTTSPIQAAISGGIDGFVTKLNAAGSARTYSTYLGGSGSEVGRGIAVDSSGNAFVIGNTSSTDFPTASPTQGASGGGTDGFLTEVNAAGSSWSFSSYIGGSGTDISLEVALSTSGDAFVSGQTTSTTFPAVGAYQSTNGGGQDATLSKFQFVAPVGVSNSTALSTPAVNATGVTFTLTSSSQSSALTKCIRVSFTTTKGSTIKPASMNISSATLGGTSTFIPTPASWSVSANNSTGVVTLTNAAGEVTSGGNGKILVLNNITNGSVANTTYYDEITSFSDVGCTTQIDHFDPTFVFTDPVTLSAQVNPTLTFTVGSTSCALGTLSNSQTKSCTYTVTAATNGSSGYSISYIATPTLTSGVNTITALASQTASTLNTEQFGINLQANTAAGSHTAANFGAAVSGGSGFVTSAYNTANSFKFVTAGDTVAQSTSASLSSTYTISTIANITNTTEAGSYATTVTFNIVAGY